jgi:hypothetical protein
LGQKKNFILNLKKIGGKKFMIKTNFKKKIVSIVLVMLMVVTMAACGSETSTTSNEATISENASTGSDVVSSIENADSNETQDVAAVEETSEVEETNEVSYIEHDSYYEDANFDWSGNTVFTTYDNDHDIKFTSADNSAYAIYDSIDLYSTNGKVMGYTKENIWCFLTATADDWYCLTIDDDAFFVKASDFEGNNALLNASNMDYDGNYIIPERDSSSSN